MAINCLTILSDTLIKEGVSADNVEFIVTAILRKNSNADDFCQQALTVLPYPIFIITGIESTTYLSRYGCYY